MKLTEKEKLKLEELAVQVKTMYARLLEESSLKRIVDLRQKGINCNKLDQLETRLISLLARYTNMGYMAAVYNDEEGVSSRSTVSSSYIDDTVISEYERFGIDGTIFYYIYSSAMDLFMTAPYKDEDGKFQPFIKIFNGCLRRKKAAIIMDRIKQQDGNACKEAWVRNEIELYLLVHNYKVKVLPPKSELNLLNREKLEKYLSEIGVPQKDIEELLSLINVTYSISYDASTTDDEGSVMDGNLVDAYQFKEHGQGEAEDNENDFRDILYERLYNEIETNKIGEWISYYLTLKIIFEYDRFYPEEHKKLVDEDFEKFYLARRTKNKDMVEARKILAEYTDFAPDTVRKKFDAVDKVMLKIASEVKWREV